MRRRAEGAVVGDEDYFLNFESQVERHAVFGGMHLLPAGALSSSLAQLVLQLAMSFAVTSFAATHGSGFASVAGVAAGVAGIAGVVGAATAGVAGVVGAATAGVAGMAGVAGVAGVADSGVDVTVVCDAGSVAAGVAPPQATMENEATNRAMFLFMGGGITPKCHSAQSLEQLH